MVRQTDLCGESQLPLRLFSEPCVSFADAVDWLSNETLLSTMKDDRLPDAGRLFAHEHIRHEKRESALWSSGS